MGVTRQERIRGGLWGLLVGDALGVPHEFKQPSELPQDIGWALPEGYRRAHAGVPVGTWSDDGAMALCLLDSLLTCQGLDLDDLAGRFVRWGSEGYLAVDGHVFDIGIQTARSLAALRQGVAPERSGGTGTWSNGNGSLMRVLPLALWHTGPDEDLIAAAHRQSLPTHAHPRSQAACALYCLWARALLDGERPEAGWTQAVARLRSHSAAHSAVHAAELEDHVLPDDGARGSGYVVHTLHSAREALRAGTFEATAVQAIRFGEDTDTTAAVACGLAGVVGGFEAIPASWRAQLRGQDRVEGLWSRWFDV